MDHSCEFCIAGSCIAHLRISHTAEDTFSPFLTEPVLSMSQNAVDGTWYSEEYGNFFGECFLVIFCASAWLTRTIDPGDSPANIQSNTTPAVASEWPAYVVNLPLRGESAVGADVICLNPDNVASAHPRDPNNPGNAAGEGPQYVLHPLSGESTFSMPRIRSFFEAPYTRDFFGLNPCNIGRAQPRDLIIDENLNPRDLFQSSFLANVDILPSTPDPRSSPSGVPPSPDAMHVSLTNRPRAFKSMRRTRPAKYHCPVMGCDKDFTKKHNLHCLYLST